MPKLLDLYSCAGGAAAGYHRAGFDVYGVDKDPQPRYPFAHNVGDAVQVLARLTFGESVTFTHPDGTTAELFLEDFDVIHASPPCQTYSATKAWHDNAHPDLVEPTREALIATGLPYVIENVPGAPLIDPVRLCGSEFDMVGPDSDGRMLKMIRHRLFESNMPLRNNGGCRHRRDYITASVYGNGGGWSIEYRDSPTRRSGYIPKTPVIQNILGIDWMTKHEMSQVVPPVMAEHIGRQIMDHLDVPAEPVALAA